MNDWVQEIINNLHEVNNLHEHKPETESEFILTNLVIRLAEVVREQQSRIEKLETRIS